MIKLPTVRLRKVRERAVFREEVDFRRLSRLSQVLPLSKKKQVLKPLRRTKIDSRGGEVLETESKMKVLDLLQRPTTLIPFYRDRGPFFESPGNFSGPRPEFGIKTRRAVARALAHKRVHFVSLTVTLLYYLQKLSTVDLE